MEESHQTATPAVESSIDGHPSTSLEHPPEVEGVATAAASPSRPGEGAKKKRRGKRLSKAERLAKREGNSSTSTDVAAPEGVSKEAHLSSLVATGQFDQAENFAFSIPDNGGLLFLADVARNVPVPPGGSGSAKLKTLVHHAKRFAVRAVAQTQDASALLDLCSKLVAELLQPLLREKRWDACAALSSALGTSLPDVPLRFPPLRIAVLALDTAEQNRKAAKASKPGSTADNDTSVGNEDGGGEEVGDGGEDEHAVRAMIARDSTLRVRETFKAVV